MRVAIFGGSFDPFHIGHYEIAKAALASGKIDELLVIPAGDPPHKSAGLAMGVYRYQMAKLGLQDLKNSKVSRIELARSGRVSYTVQTVRLLREIYNKKGFENVEFSLVIGSDVLESFHLWFKPEEVVKEASLLCAMRGKLNSSEKEKIKKVAAKLKAELGAKIEFFEMKAKDLSSTELRLAMAKGEIPKKAFPPEVEKFIKTHQPYRWTDNIKSLSEEDLARLFSFEQKVWNLMPESRLVHSMNVSMYALHLANIHGVDPGRAALAGLLHDVAKYFPKEQVVKLARVRSIAKDLNTQIAHGPAGAAFIHRYYGIHDMDMLRAIHFHTTARSGMSPLEKILFLADKIELGRNFKDLKEIRELAEINLDAALKLCLKEVIKACKRKKIKAHRLTIEALESIKLA